MSIVDGTYDDVVEADVVDDSAPNGPKESREDAAARRIEKAAYAWKKRCDTFEKLIAHNVSDLSAEQREFMGNWIARRANRLCEVVRGADEDFPRLRLTTSPEPVDD